MTTLYVWTHLAAAKLKSSRFDFSQHFHLLAILLNLFPSLSLPTHFRTRGFVLEFFPKGLPPVKISNHHISHDYFSFSGYAGLCSHTHHNTSHAILLPTMLLLKVFLLQCAPLLTTIFSLLLPCLLGEF